VVVNARGRLLVVVMALVALWGSALSAQALAAMAATESRSQTAATAKWSVVISSAHATASTSGPVSAPLDGNTFWWISNNGTAKLNPVFRFTITITTTGGAAAYLEECSGGAWNEVADTCSGTVTVIAQPNATTAYTLPAAYPAGAYSRLRLHVTAGGAGNTAVLSTDISR
jgi:hypothetical protein